MLILPIKKKWFDKIQSGEKKEEYREIKPYYTTRFRNVLHIPKPVSDNAFFERMRRPHNAFKVCFRNGYSAKSQSYTAMVSLSIGTGKEEWGAEQGKEYYVLRILEI